MASAATTPIRCRLDVCFEPEDLGGSIECDNDEATFPSLTRVESHSEDNYDAQTAAADLTGTTPTQPSFAHLRSTTSSRMTATTPSPQRTGVSPSSSPRLPSPPPFTEVQIGPKSPTVGEGPENQLGHSTKHDDGATRRIRPGTKAADMASGPPLIPLAELESPFQLQEHLKALYHVHRRGNNDTIVPITRQTAVTLSTPPVGIDKPLWLYELCRFLTMKANNLIIAFFADSPPCSAATCPEMRASEWQYLCAVHDPPKSCCAIDYCCHTLDWAANILTSPKYFPSRLSLGGDMGGGGGGGGGSQASMRHLTNIFRRVYRIFAHAWFQHRGVFWQVEGHEGLYVFFKTVCDMYQLIPEDNYTIPSEAEGGDGDSSETPVEKKSPDASRTSLLRKSTEIGPGHGGQDGDGEATTTVSVGATTRRHKHTPSTGSHVTSIAEGLEEDEDEDEDEEGQSPRGVEEKGSQEQVEPQRGRALPTSDDTIAQGLGKLSLGDLGPAADKDGPAEQPTPQPRQFDNNPMEDINMNESPSIGSDTTVVEVAQDLDLERNGKTSEEAEELPQQQLSPGDTKTAQGESEGGTSESTVKDQADTVEGDRDPDDKETGKEEAVEEEVAS